MGYYRQQHAVTIREHTNVHGQEVPSLTFDAATMQQLARPPSWRVHRLASEQRPIDQAVRDTQTCDVWEAVSRGMTLRWRKKRQSAFQTSGSTPPLFMPAPSSLLRHLPDDWPKHFVVIGDVVQVAQHVQSFFAHTAVLINACRTKPGGGVWSGKGAGEEGLYRRSNLYFVQDNCDAYPLQLNKAITTTATFFRGSEDAGYPILQQWWTTAVIAAAAVRNPLQQQSARSAGMEYRFEEDACAMIDTVVTIFKAAIETGAEALIITPFGCGAFHNPVQEVAWMFAEIAQQTELRLIVAVKEDHNLQPETANTFAQAIQQAQIAESSHALVNTIFLI